jgi:hypothetical protein
VGLDSRAICQDLRSLGVYGLALVDGSNHLVCLLLHRHPALEVAAYDCPAVFANLDHQPRPSKHLAALGVYHIQFKRAVVEQDAPSAPVPLTHRPCAYRHRR